MTSTGIMIPRLTPRRSTTPSNSHHDVENDNPMDATRTGTSFPSKVSSIDSGDDEEGTIQTLSPRQRTVLTSRSSSTSCTTSRSSSIPIHGKQHPSHLEAPLSPAVTQATHDAYLLHPSSALTPPMTGPRPLVVSAKRVAHHVRRSNSSKRLRRRRTSTTTTLDRNDSTDTTTSSSSSNPTNDDAAHCLWRDAGMPSRPVDTSSDEEGEGESLPCHPNPQGYWDYCYGSNATTSRTQPIHDGISTESRVEGTVDTTIPTSTSSSWSANRKPPIKGCFTRKKRSESRINSALQSFLTPPTSPDELVKPGDQSTSHHPPKMTTSGHRVQFGSPQAVEFDSEGPTVQLTPLPAEITRERYSMMQDEPTEESVNMSAETKRNSALLAEWDDDGPLQGTSSAARRRQQRKNRRSSSIFTPSPSSSSLLDDSDDEMMQVSNKFDMERREESPATMVLENLASLCVDSPSMTTDRPILLPRTSSSIVGTSSDSSSSSTDASQRSPTISTTELAIPLGDLHTLGAATVSARVRQVPSPDASNPTGGSLPMSLEAIHSMGGALGTMSCHSTGRQLSPISRMSQSDVDTIPSPTATNRSEEDQDKILQSPRLDIVQLLLKDPSADQTFDPRDVFSALVKRDTNEPCFKAKRSGLAEIINSVSPRWDGVLSCLEDLKEQVRFCANTRSNTKFRLPASQEAFARQMVIREWKELEMEFFLELSQALERNTEQARALWHTANNLLDGLKGILAPPKHDDAQGVQHSKVTAKELEEEIVKLEEEIQEQQKLAHIREAAEAPYAALLCQASSHIGVCGFRLDDYDGTTLQIAYEHPIAGVESHFTHDMTQGLWSATYVSDAFISSPELLPASHPAAKFHEKVAMICFADENRLLQQVRDVDLSDAVLTLSLWLGRLDAATHELLNVSNKHAVTFDWPVLNVQLSDSATLALRYDDESVCQTIRPTSAVATLDHQQTDMDTSATIRSMIERALSGLPTTEER